MKTPQDKDWREEFYDKFDFFECSALSPNAIESFIEKTLAAQREKMREKIKKLYVQKPMCEADEKIYDMKKSWLEETKAALLSAIKEV